MTILFDHHKYAKRLQDAGMSPALADIQAETTGELMNELNVLNAKLDSLASDTSIRFERTDAKIDQVEVRVNTRIDQGNIALNSKIDQVNMDLNNKIEKMDLRLSGRVELVESRIETKITESRAELIRWVVGVGILQMSLISALLLRILH